MKTLLRLALSLLAFSALTSAPAGAEQQDVAVAVRSVVRVVIIATNGDQA